LLSYDNWGEKNEMLVGGGGGDHVCDTLRLDREVPKEMKEQNKIPEET
jgi:hypothetical protein